MERVKRYNMLGISDPELVENTDVHDKRLFDFFDGLASEILERIELYNEQI